MSDTEMGADVITAVPGQALKIEYEVLIVEQRRFRFLRNPGQKRNPFYRRQLHKSDLAVKIVSAVRRGQVREIESRLHQRVWPWSEKLFQPVPDSADIRIRVA